MERDKFAVEGRVEIDPADLTVLVEGEGRAAHVDVALGLFGTRTSLLPVGGVVVDRHGHTISLGEGRKRPSGGGTTRTS